MRVGARIVEEMGEWPDPGSSFCPIGGQERAHSLMRELDHYLPSDKRILRCLQSLAEIVQAKFMRDEWREVDLTKEIQGFAEIFWLRHRTRDRQ